MQDVFTAVADPTRRAILARLLDDEPLSVKELAAALPITRQAVTKHLDTLVASGLVRLERAGRERLHTLDPRPLVEIDRWLAPYAAAWDRRLARLESYLEERP